MPFARWGWRELNLFGWPLLAAIDRLAVARRTVVLAGDRAGCAVCAVACISSAIRRATIPDGPDAIVAPADGTVVEVTPLEHYDFLGGPAVRIGIFLSIFNVHINRAPLAGRVVEMHYQPGEFLNAMRPESAERNEFMWIGFEDADDPHGRFAVRQISGCWPGGLSARCSPDRRSRAAKSLV